MTKEIANYILKITRNDDYDVIDIYEDSFRAIRKNEWILSEINIEYLGDIKKIFYIDTDIIKSYLYMTRHVLKRYKG